MSFSIKELSDLSIPGANSRGLGSALASVVHLVEEREPHDIKFLVMKSRAASGLIPVFPKVQQSWICQRCQWRRNNQRLFSQAPPAVADKPYYVTSPIFYVNAGTTITEYANVSKD